MIESFNFEYKQTKMFQDIQPAGLSVYGERGVEGKDGVRGSTVYFINYSTISDDLKSTLLTRINGSTDLNGSGDTRIYYNNDLIICEISESIYNYIYKIIKTDNISKPYDIERLGYIESETNIANVFDCIHSVKLNRDAYTTTECHVPVNRSYEYSKTNNLVTANNLVYVDGAGHQDDASICASNYSDALRLLFGFYVAPKISLTNRNIINNYEFYMKIHIKNRKTILGRNNLPILKGFSTEYKANINEEPFTDNININNVLFEKVIEIPVSKSWRNGNSDEMIDEKRSYYISDMACDKLHPSINNYSSAFFDPYRCNGYITSVIDNYSFPFHFFMFKYSFNNYLNIDNNYYCIGKNITKKSSNSPVDSSILNEIISASKRNYNAPDSSSASSTIIQYSKNPNINSSCKYCEVRYRSGESAYFSSMISDNHFPSNCFDPSALQQTKNIASLSCNTFDQYVASQRSLNKNLRLDYEYGDSSETFCNKRINIVKNYVCEEMNRFIFNENNVFELVCVDTRTGRTKSKILPLNQIL